MAKVEVVLNSAGIIELMKSAEMVACCKAYAQQVANRAGEGYEVNTHIGPTRWNAEVKAETKQAYRENMKNNTLLKALGV